MSTVPETASIDQLCEELYGTTTAESVRQEWEHAVRGVAAKATETLPDASAERIQKAVTIVLGYGVELLPDGKARVESQGDKGFVYHLANGSCDCKDFERAPARWCKHRLAKALHIRAMRAIEQTTEEMAQVPVVPSVEAPADIPAQFIVELHGKQFVTYAGLLALAHQRGLTSLTARFISVTGEVALAEATAVFADGRTFAEAADATPGNVGSKVKAHFARMALTRAKARCLRDALNISMCSLEEIAE